MKKSLIALAVLGFAGAAMAQSSVTLYGVADAGVSHSQTTTLNPDGTIAKVSKNGFMSSSLMNNGNSRFGLRGTEDLGGGLKVGFNFEDGLRLTNGSAGTSGGQFFSREANMWIGGNWGTLVLGRDLNPSFFGLAAWELTNTANYSAVGDTYGYTGEGPRSSSMFAYRTPSFNGLTASLAFVPKDNSSDNELNAGGAAGTIGKAHWDANVIYANGPIGAGLSVNKTQSLKTNYALGGKYNFGSFIVAASYNNVNGGYAGQNLTSGGADAFASMTNDTDPNARRRGFSIGGTYLTGPFSLTVDLTRDTKNEFSPTLRKYTNGVVEGKYALSKRTFLYAAYLRLDSTNNYGIGLRHNF